MKFFSTKFLALFLSSSFVFYLLVTITRPQGLVEEFPRSFVVFDEDDKLVSFSLARDEKYRLPVNLNDVSEHLIKATLTYEDRYFYYHFGVNPISLARVTLSSLFKLKRPFGASTITMQFVRLKHGLKTRSILAKIKQIFFAIYYEIGFSKDQILEAYLSIAPYGANIEGIEAASLIYYNKNARNLTLDEAVTLAVIPQDPSRRWRVKGHAELAEARNRLVKKIDNGGIIVPRDFVGGANLVPKFAPHFSERLNQENPAMSVYRSTLNLGLHRQIEAILSENLNRYADLGINNGAVLLVETRNMEVKAYVGSASYLDRKIEGYVNGLNAERSPGSLLKPFVYGLGLDQGLILPETLLSDLPIRLASYNPENFERNFIGPVSAVDALVKSRNIPALEVFRKLKANSFYDLLKNAGVGRLKSAEYYGLALVLGGLGVTAEETAVLYAAIANQGKVKKLKFLKQDTEIGTKEIFTKEASFLLKKMLANNPPALGKFRQLNIPWKTGTSYGSRDAWAAGIIGTHVLVVWVGNFNNQPNPNFIGRDIAGPIFFTIADLLVKQNYQLSSLNQTEPANLNIKKVKVCSLSGALPSLDCPHLKESLYIPGVSPIKTCEIHKSILIDSKTGFRQCEGEKTGDSKVFEIWDYQTLKLFEQGGLSRNTPPPYHPNCKITQQGGRTIRIVSPEEHIEYYIEEHRPLELEFKAAPLIDAQTLTWFIDNSLVAQIEAGKSYYWPAKAGRYVISVVDNLGRANSIKVRIRTSTQVE